MDIALSIVAGLGLRLFLITTTEAGTTSPLTAALLGLWEGVVVHQLSGRSSSPHLDHFLAYALRIAVDLLISKNYPRIFMILLWTALGSITSEAVVPHASLLTQRKREREKERRHRHTRSVTTAVPILSTPLPPRVRAYRQPDQSQTLPAAPPVPDPSQPGPSTSTPHFHSIPPPSPPSFFLQENSELYSPPPKPVQLQSFNNDAFTHDALPVRPPSALASILDRSPDSGSPLPVPIHLPTPPASAESGVPSDSQNIDDYQIQESRRLSTIDELSADDNPGTDEHQQDSDTLIPETTHVITVNYAPSIAITAPLPVPNTGLRYIANGGIAKWLTSQPGKHNPETIFNTPFSPSSKPIPVPVPVRNQGTLWQTLTPTRSHIEDEAKQAEDGVFEVEVGGDNPADIDEQQSETESDELQTPGPRPVLNMETDNEYDGDELRTPSILRRPGREEYNENGDILSPLALNMRSALNSSDEFVHAIAESEEGYASGSGQQPANNEQLPSPKINTNDYDAPIPGSLSQNLLLQPPLPPSGPLFRLAASPPPESPVPPSPSTIASETSDVSILSTRLPSKLYSKGDAIRKTAWDREQLRAKLEADRKQAENEKRVGDALKLKIQIKELDKESLKLHEQAARRYYAARNPMGMSTKIDVHGLRSREAFERVERALLKVIDEGKNTLRVIVGKGLHSANNQPVLKNTVQREMLRQGFKCEVDVRNPGILIVTIPPRNPPS